MLRHFCLAVFITTLMPGEAGAGETMFPPEYANLAFTCASSDSAGSNPVPLLSAGEQQWFSNNLHAAREPSLYDASLRAGAPQALRFTWLRSFHRPLTVRVTQEKNGAWRVIAKELSGKGGYNPGHIARTINRQLRADETAALKSLLAVVELPDLSGDCVLGDELGVDGAQWIIERTDERGYHFINRWSPSDGPVREVGLFLLRLTGWNYKPVY